MAGGAKFVIVRAVRLALGAVFVYAGVRKALDPAAFATAVRHYHLVPPLVAAAIAVYLPWLEVVCGAALGWRRARLGALNLLLLLCLLFAGVLTSALVRHLDIACGCFGGGAAGRIPLQVDLVRSLVLAGACVFLLWSELNPAAVPEVPHR